MMRILGMFALLLAVSCLTLTARDVRAAVTGSDLSPTYQSEEGEKKEDEEPDCD